MKRNLSFSYSWQAPDSRPRISAAGVTGKTAWVQVDYNGVIFGASVSKSLVKQLKREQNRQNP